MSATTTALATITPAAEAYVVAVAAALAGVPEAERQDLLDDLADHLAELAAEDGEPLAVRLGAPEAYAAELVASAGIDVGPPGPTVVVPLWQRGVESVGRHLSSERADAVRAFLPELRPGWWVLRGWCAMAILAVMATPDEREVFPLPEVFGNPVLSIVALGAACTASVRLGRRRGWANAVATALGVLGLVVAVVAGGDRTEYVYETGDGYGYGFLTAPDGRVIDNIWPYDGAGNPLDGVLLFDQEGVPIDLGGDPGSSQVPVAGLFPKQQSTYEYDPVTGLERAVPVAPPTVSIPQLPSGTASDTTTTTTLAPGS